ncbi:MAG: M3 family metallopeptidase, partial [archaeon]
MPAPTPPEWDLTPLFANEKTFHAALQRIEARVDAFQKYQKKLPHATRALIQEIMEEKEALGNEMSRAGAYAALSFAQNTQDEHAKTRESVLGRKSMQWRNKTLFFSMWWKSLDEKKMNALLPPNKEYAFTLKEMHKYRHYTLSEAEEKIINIKDSTGGDALVTLYDVITNAFTYEWKNSTEKEKIQKISEEELRAKFSNPHAETRKRAYDLLWEKYAEHQPVLGEIYRNTALDMWNEGIALRKYEKPISMRNKANDLDDEMVEAFLNVCKNEVEVFQDYHAWKAKELHVPLERYHLYAPFDMPKSEWSFEDAQKTVMNTLEDFSPRFRKEAERVIVEKRLDAKLRPGKQSGAFCMGHSPRETSYVMMNWSGRLRDVSTLAHELGHAVHNHLASERTLFTHHAGLPLAETASTFAEMLLSEKMMSETRDENVKKYLLGHQLDDAYATIQRQAFFSLFEQDAFDLIHAGKTIPDLTEAYRENLRTQFGKKMKMPEKSAHEWLVIPHFFHSPFYVYAYAFGQLLVYAFFEQYQREGKDFVKRYEKFL